MLTVSSRKVVRDSVRGISEFDYAIIVFSELIDPETTAKGDIRYGYLLLPFLMHESEINYKSNADHLITLPKH